MATRLAAVLFTLSAVVVPAHAQDASDYCADIEIEFMRLDPGSTVEIAISYGYGTRSSGYGCNHDVPPAPENPFEVDLEVTGANDPDGSATPATPDLTCEITSGLSCSVSYVGPESGVDEVRAWFDLDRDDATDERDDTEGVREFSFPGDAAEPDGTDVAQVEWRLTECSDGLDNDGDGAIDHPNDPECHSADDDDETDTFVCSCAPPRCRQFPNMIIGTAGDDELIGTSGRDCIYGGGGNDLIYGRGGDDVLLGGGGNDLLDGGRGHDDLRGNSGDDLLLGERGSDVAYGGPGIDEIRGGASEDHLRGGGGGDAIVGGRGGDQLRGQDGNDELVGGRGRDDVRGGPGRDSCSGEVISTCE